MASSPKLGIRGCIKLALVAISTCAFAASALAQSNISALGWQPARTDDVQTPQVQKVQFQSQPPVPGLPSYQSGGSLSDAASRPPTLPPNAPPSSAPNNAMVMPPANGSVYPQNLQAPVQPPSQAPVMPPSQSLSQTQTLNPYDPRNGNLNQGNPNYSSPSYGNPGNGYSSQGNPTTGMYGAPPMPATQAILPPASNQLSGNQNASVYPAPQTPGNSQPVYPQPIYPQPAQSAMPPTQSGQPAMRSAPTAQNGPGGSSSGNVTESGDLRPINNSNSKSSASNTGGTPASLAAEQIATGLPYVTPAPRSRYATSPYRPAVFQTTAFQTTALQTPPPNAPVVSNPAGTVRPTSIPTQLVSTPTAVAAQQTQVPQNQYPGIYPTAYQCPPGSVYPSPTYPPVGAVPGAYVPPTLPPNLAPTVYSTNNSGYRPVFSLGQENFNVQLGRGIVGQPTVYVPGQWFRNFFRYLSP